MLEKSIVSDAVHVSSFILLLFIMSISSCASFHRWMQARGGVDDDRSLDEYADPDGIAGAETLRKFSTKKQCLILLLSVLVGLLLSINHSTSLSLDRNGPTFTETWTQSAA
jgi:hypothetical protein